MRRLAIPALCALAFFGPERSTAARVPSPPPGVPARLAALGVERLPTGPRRRRSSWGRQVRLQDRITDSRTESHIRPILGRAYGGSRVRRLERLLRSRGVGRIVDLVGVRSSLRALFDAHEKLERGLGPLIREGRLETSMNTSLNWLEVKLDRTLGDDERRRVDRLAAESSVDVAVL